MDAFNTVLTCAPRLRAALMANPAITAHTDRIFPVVSKADEQLPFIAFYRSGIESENTKSDPCRAAFYEFQIYSGTWKEGLELAEAVIDTLDGFADDAIRFCRLWGGEEDFFKDAPAYVQTLTFRVKTNF